MRRITLAVLLAALLLEPSFANIASPAISRTEAGESFIRFAWQPVPGSVGYNVYLKSAEGRFVKLNKTPVLDTTVRVRDLQNGQPYVFAVTSLDGRGEESNAAITPLLAPSGYAYKTVTVPGGTKAADYVLLTIPYYTGGKTAKDLFGYLPRYDASKWRIFSMDAAGFHEYEEIGGIEPGKAYWFIAARKTDLFLSGRTADGAAPFRMRLAAGWNLVGSPFLYPVDWEAVLKANPEAAPYLGPAVWEFGRGGFEKAGSLLPFHGYMVYNAGEEVDVTIPAAPAAPKLYVEGETVSAGAAGEAAGGWTVRLSATDGIYRDTDNYLGVRPAPTETGALNTPEPPAWPQHLSLFFLRRNETEIRRSTDLRGEGKSWITVVQGGENRQVTLSWEIGAGSPRMTLYDLAKNRRIDMHRQSSYVFSRHNTLPRKFIITAMSEESGNRR